MFQGFQLPLSSAKSTYGKLKDQPSALYSDNQSIHTCWVAREPIVGDLVGLWAEAIVPMSAFSKHQNKLQKTRLCETGIVAGWLLQLNSAPIRSTFGAYSQTQSHRTSYLFFKLCLVFSSFLNFDEFNHASNLVICFSSSKKISALKHVWMIHMVPFCSLLI